MALEINQIHAAVGNSGGNRLAFVSREIQVFLTLAAFVEIRIFRAPLDPVRIVEALPVFHEIPFITFIAFINLGVILITILLVLGRLANTLCLVQVLPFSA